MEQSSWYVFAEMMLASAPESTFMVCCCPLILMFTIMLRYSFQSFVKFPCDTLFVFLTWSSTDLQIFPKCLFLLQTLQMASRDLQQLACGTFSPFFFFVSLFLKFLSSAWVVVSSLIIGYGIHSNGMSIGVESIVFQEIHFPLCQP